MFENKIFLRVFSLVVAILIWAYVVIEVDPEKSAKVMVDVSFTNEEVLAEDDLAALEPDNMTVTASINGSRSRVNKIRKTGLTAYVDVSSCKKGENSREIVVNVPDGISIEELYQENLTFDVEELVAELKPVAVEFIGSGEEGRSGSNKDNVPWVISTEPDEVTAAGAKSAVDKVAAVRAQVSSGGLSKDEGRWVPLTVVPVDKHGKKVSGVYIPDSEYIRAEIRLLKLRKVPVDADVVNIEENLELDRAEDYEDIIIAGPEDIIDSIDSIKGTVDMTGVTETGVSEAEMYLELPDGIYLYEEKNPVTVKIRLKAAE